MDTEIVERSTIQPRVRMATGIYAELLAKLLDLKRSQALKVPSRDRKQAIHIARSVRNLGKKESLNVRWERNQAGTLVYLWIETRGAK